MNERSDPTLEEKGMNHKIISGEVTHLTPDDVVGLMNSFGPEIGIAMAYEISAPPPSREIPPGFDEWK